MCWPGIWAGPLFVSFGGVVVMPWSCLLGIAVEPAGTSCALGEICCMTPAQHTGINCDPTCRLWLLVDAEQLFKVKITPFCLAVGLIRRWCGQASCIQHHNTQINLHTPQHTTCITVTHSTTLSCVLVSMKTWTVCYLSPL